jgi:hypothetical protein
VYWIGNALTWSATYNAAGKIVSEQDNGGGQMARTNSYQYYSAGHQWAGKLQTVTDGRRIKRTSTYDDYLRLVTLITAGALPESTITNRYEYDRRDLVKLLRISIWRRGSESNANAKPLRPHLTQLQGSA